MHQVRHLYIERSVFEDPSWPCVVLFNKLSRIERQNRPKYKCQCVEFNCFQSKLYNFNYKALKSLTSEPIIKRKTIATIKLYLIIFDN